MKDYTKYNFAAIVGAKISVLLKNKVEYGGTLILASNKAIFLLMNDNPLALEGRWIAIDEIVPGSLTAKIKVEDMSVNQLKRLLKTYQDPVSEHAFVITEDGVYHSILTALKEIGKQDFTDYIDCTDWGWRE